MGSTEYMLKYMCKMISRGYCKTPPGGINEPLTKSVNDALCKSTLFIIKHRYNLTSCILLLNRCSYSNSVFTCIVNYLFESEKLFKKMRNKSTF